MADTPIIGYNNLLRGTSYTVLAGTDTPAAPLSDAWTWNMSRPALPVADATGKFSFSIPVTAGVGYGVDASGSFVAYGTILPYGGAGMADTLLLGAPRNNAALTKFANGTIQVLADAVEVYNKAIYSPGNTSQVFQLAPHVAPATYTVTITGLTPSATVRIPEMFIGPVLHMPGLELGFDAYGERFARTKFESATGHVIISRKFIRLEKQFRWRYVEPAKRNEFVSFIEQALEIQQPFWIAEFPDTLPTNCYLGFHDAETMPLPLDVAMRTDVSIRFAEKL